MNVTIPVSGGLMAAAVFVGKKILNIGQERVRKWDKHCIDDDLLHAVIQVKLEEQSNRLKSADAKLDRLVDTLIDGR